jgi:predicted nucleotide-binding protein
MDVAVKVLEALLALSTIRLVARERVFIVHGRSDVFRQELQDILKNEGIDSVVVQSFARTGQDLLSFLEDRIKDCVAGFVVLTPDDEGRLYHFGEPLRQRARQNVIFEGGYLTALFRNTNRVCFLQQGELEIPSDLNGLLMERFTDHIDPERIRLTLKEWGFAANSSQEPKISLPRAKA